MAQIDKKTAYEMGREAAMRHLMDMRSGSEPGDFAAMPYSDGQCHILWKEFDAGTFRLDAARPEWLKEIMSQYGMGVRFPNVATCMKFIEGYQSLTRDDRDEILNRFRSLRDAALPVLLRQAMQSHEEEKKRGD